MDRVAELEEALRQIGNLPLEFNTRARALAQRAVTPPPEGWRDHLTQEQIRKVLNWTPPTAHKESDMNTETKQQAENTMPYNPPQIDMVPVESKMLRGIGHDGNQTLRVWFHKGAPYDYVGLGEEDFFTVINSDSVGRAYQAIIREREIKGIKLQEVN